MPFREILNKLIGGQTFLLTEALFLRLLGLVYLLAFASLWPQIAALIGSTGIVPAGLTMTALRGELGRAAYLDVPSLVWLFPGDRALVAFCAAGCLAALLLLAGIFSRWAAVACYVLYLSLVSIGQPFTSFQWDALLLEAGFLAIFAGAQLLPLAYRFLLFRLIFESGLVKLTSHDPNWRNLHALRYHFLTQPLPTPLAYYLYWAPPWLLDSLTAATLFIELCVPFLLFGPKRLRQIAVGLIVLLQLAIALTGNYTFFNLLTVALCLWALDDAPFTRLRRFLLTRRLHKSHSLLNIPVVCLLVLGILQICGQLVPSFLESFEIVNSYGLFAIMTTSRSEIVIEGSNDGVAWKAYSFRYKPGKLNRALPIVAPFQPRLDWQMWFAALGNARENTWVQSLLYRLLSGDKNVLALLEPAPFPQPPRYIRAVIYDYTFTTPAQRSQTGAIWQTKLLGNWFGPVSLE